MSKNPKKKNSILAVAIGIFILAYIVSRYLSVIIAVICAFLLFCFFLGLLSAKESKNNAEQEHHAATADAEREQVKRHVEILSDSLNLVNDSNNLDVVLRRYNTAIDALVKLSAYTDAELNTFGFHLKEPLQETLSRMENNKITIFNQAIVRNMGHDINSVSKTESKVKKIQSFYDKYKNNPRLLPENKDFMHTLCDTNISKYSQKNYILEDSINHMVYTATISEQGTYSCQFRRDDFINNFYELSALIDSSKDIHTKLDACEKSYPLLKEFCRFCIENDDDGLPPIINCRDVGPELYMRLGRWDDVERVLQICSDANAYYPDDDYKIWSDFYDYKRVAILAVSYIQRNPGCLQSKMYDALNVTDDDRENLKHFLRCSLQIKKEKSGSTNKLYIA